jgi:hypothetical protein
MALHMRAPIERAGELFGEEVQRIPGVLRVERSDDISGRRSFRVSVRKGDRDARYSVYQLEADTYKRFEGVSLDIHVVEEVVPAEAGSDSSAAG